MLNDFLYIRTGIVLDIILDVTAFSSLELLFQLSDPSLGFLSLSVVLITLSPHLLERLIGPVSLKLL